jgi:hypothetical protein
MRHVGDTAPAGGCRASAPLTATPPLALDRCALRSEHDGFARLGSRSVCRWAMNAAIADLESESGANIGPMSCGTIWCAYGVFAELVQTRLIDCAGRFGTERRCSSGRRRVEALNTSQRIEWHQTTHTTADARAGHPGADDTDAENAACTTCAGPIARRARTDFVSREGNGLDETRRFGSTLTDSAATPFGHLTPHPRTTRSFHCSTPHRRTTGALQHSTPRRHSATAFPYSTPRHASTSPLRFPFAPEKRSLTIRSHGT